MPWTTSYLEDLDVVLTVYAGVIPPADLQKAAAATLKLAREQGTHRLLGDCATLEGGHSIVDLYGLGQMLESLPLPAGLHEALVMPQLTAVARDVHFGETTCRNRGIDVRVFKTMDEALAWLAALKSPTKA